MILSTETGAGTGADLVTGTAGRAVYRTVDFSLRGVIDEGIVRIDLGVGYRLCMCVCVRE